MWRQQTKADPGFWASAVARGGNKGPVADGGCKSGRKSRGHGGEESVEKQQRKAEKEMRDWRQQALGGAGRGRNGSTCGPASLGRRDKGQASSAAVCAREHVSMRAVGGRGWLLFSPQNHRQSHLLGAKG